MAKKLSIYRCFNRLGGVMLSAVMSAIVERYLDNKDQVIEVAALAEDLGETAEQVVFALRRLGKLGLLPKLQDGLDWAQVSSFSVQGFSIMIQPQQGKLIEEGSEAEQKPKGKKGKGKKAEPEAEAEIDRRRAGTAVINGWTVEVKEDAESGFLPWRMDAVLMNGTDIREGKGGNFMTPEEAWNSAHERCEAESTEPQPGITQWLKGIIGLGDSDKVVEVELEPATFGLAVNAVLETSGVQFTMLEPDYEKWCEKVAAAETNEHDGGMAVELIMESGKFRYDRGEFVRDEFGAEWKDTAKPAQHDNIIQWAEALEPNAAGHIVLSRESHRQLGAALWPGDEPADGGRFTHEGRLYRTPELPGEMASVWQPQERQAV